MARWAFPNVYSGSWVGFFAPAKTPDAVVAKLNAEINEIMKEPEAQQKIKAIGFDPIIKTQDEAADYFKSEVATWGKMTRAIGFSSELSSPLAPQPTGSERPSSPAHARTLRIAVLPPLHGGERVLQRALQLVELLDALAVKAEMAAQLLVVRAVDRHAVMQVLAGRGAVRDSDARGPFASPRISCC